MTKADLENIILSEGGYDVFESCGFLCEMKRNAMGAWCGYVHLPLGHPWYGKGYDDIPVEVHGGLTFAEELEKMWCIGFDTNHWGDLSLMSFSITPTGFGDGTYKDKTYVKQEIDNLAFEAALIHKPSNNVLEAVIARKHLTNGQ